MRWRAHQVAVGSFILALGCAGEDPTTPFSTLAVATASLPDGVEARSYSETLAATGGDGSYTWLVAAGSLPNGLSLNPSSGEVSGIPTTDETRNFTVEVSSGDGQTATQELTIAVRAVLRPDESCGDFPDEAIATFEDARLEEAARFELFGYGTAGDITCGLLSGVTEFWARLRGVTSLVGIQNLTRVTALHLDSNAITDVGPLGALASLERLSIYSNSITDIGVLSGLDNLRDLSLHSNSITDISPLRGLTSLTHVNLGANSITDIGPLSGLPNLMVLYLGTNPLTDISPLNGLTSLSVLSLERGSITDVTLSGLTGLSFLLLSGNSITDVALSGLTSLWSLDLSDNTITDLSRVTGLEALRSLNLSDNAITDVGPLSELTSLTQLFLENSSITDIGPLSGLTAMLDLTLASGSVTDLSALSGLTELRWLDLKNNVDLTDIQPLLDNTGLGPGWYDSSGRYQGDVVDLTSTSVTCTAVAALEAKGVFVASDCP